MICKKFKPRFAPLVRDGRKRQTIRPTPKGTWPQVGDEFRGEEWSGKPYRSKVNILCHGTVTAAVACEVCVDGIALSESDYNLLGSPSHEQIAAADGFSSFEELKQWFLDEHGALPFTGVLIRWE
jgi:hypothetical protein